MTCRWVDSFPTGSCPHLAELIVRHALEPGYDHGDEVEPRLDLILEILDGLAPPRFRLRTQTRHFRSG